MRLKSRVEIFSSFHLGCVLYEGVEIGKWNEIPFLPHSYICISFTRIGMESKVILAETNSYFFKTRENPDFLKKSKTVSLVKDMEFF